MPVYHNGIDVEVVAGDWSEGWAAVQYEDGSVRDVNIGELGAEGRGDEIQEAIEAANEDHDLDFDKYRVRVRYPKESLVIETHGNKKLYTENFMDTMFEDDDVDDYEFVASTVMGAIRAVDMAHRQPNRMLWRNREALKEATV